MFNGFSELPLMIFRLPVFYKQRDNFFHPAWAWTASSWILRLPYSVVEAVVWSCVVYYTVGLAPDAGRYLLFGHSIIQIFIYVFFIFTISTKFLQVFSLYVPTLLNTPNGIGSVPDDGISCT